MIEIEYNLNSDSKLLREWYVIRKNDWFDIRECIHFDDYISTICIDHEWTSDDTLVLLFNTDEEVLTFNLKYL